MSEYRLNPGDAAPDMELEVWPDGRMRLSDLRGRWIALYFYPKDNTPGCTNEARDFRDSAADFEALDAVILGASRDSIASHQRFAEKHELPFRLISDPDETLCQAFDVIQMKNMYGRQVRGIERATFLIDPDGVVRHVWRKVRVKGHVAEVLDTLRALKG